MVHSATYHSMVPYRRTRAFFLLRIAQHVRSLDVRRELGRALVALAGAASWAAVVILLAGA